MAATVTFDPRRLVGARLKRGMNQGDLAYELRRRHGIKADQGQISRWETGKNTPRAHVIPALAAVLGVSMEQLYAPDDQRVRGADDDEETDPVAALTDAIRRVIRGEIEASA
jgi:transcriptional regulator with XRE-family HTH domain